MRRIPLVIAAALLVFPIYWMVIGSFRNTPGLFAVPPQFWPARVTLMSYRELLTSAPVVWIVNAGVIAAFAVVGSVLISMAAGYAFAFYDFPGKRLLYLVLLLGVMIPRQMLTIPMFIEVRALGLVDTRVGAILPLLYCPVGIFFATNWLRNLSRSHIEEARLAGARGWQLLHLVLLPLCAPVVGVIMLIVGSAAFSDYFWQSLVLQSEQRWTLQLGLVARMQLVDTTKRAHTQGMRLAAAVIMMAPLAILGLLSQRQFVDNVSRGIAE